MKSILDPSFRYTASFNTDLRRTFARILRAHWKEAQPVLVAPLDTCDDDALDNVVSIVGRPAIPGAETRA